MKIKSNYIQEFIILCRSSPKFLFFLIIIIITYVFFNVIFVGVFNQYCIFAF